LRVRFRRYSIFMDPELHARDVWHIAIRATVSCHISGSRKQIRAELREACSLLDEFGFGVLFRARVSVAILRDFPANYWRVFRGLQIRPVPRVRIHISPPYSLVSVPRLSGAGPINKQFSSLGPGKGRLQALKPNCFLRNYRNIPNRLKQQICEFGSGDTQFSWPRNCLLGTPCKLRYG